MKFKVTQIFRDGHDNLDDDVKIIDANNKEEAEKIYCEKNFRIKGFYKLTVEPMEENNEFKRIQELAGMDNVNEGNKFTIDSGPTGITTQVEEVKNEGYILIQTQGTKKDTIFLTQERIVELHNKI